MYRRRVRLSSPKRFRKRIKRHPELLSKNVGDKVMKQSDDYFEVRLGRGSFAINDAARFKIIGSIERGGQGKEFLNLRLVIDKRWVIISGSVLLLGCIGIILMGYDLIMIPIWFLLIAVQVLLYTLFSLRQAKKAFNKIEALNSK